MKIGIANDHVGTNLKYELIEFLQNEKYEVIDYGTDSTSTSDYPIFAKKLANGIKDGDVDLGVAICGTGLGMSYACNKIEGIRAACVSETLSARLSRQHNNANIICFGARIIGNEVAKEIVKTFIETPFSNDERHIKRVNMIEE